MKPLVLVFLLLCSVVTFAQEYTEVVQIENKNADELYVKAKEWFVLSFNSANDVIQLDDKENKKLIGKGIKKIEHYVNGISVPLSMYFTLITEFKDGRYKCELKPTSYKANGGEEYTYELLKQVTTKDGLLEYYKRKGIKPFVLGKKQIAKNLESNNLLFEKVNKAIQSIPADFKKYISSSETSDDNW